MVPATVPSTSEVPELCDYLLLHFGFLNGTVKHLKLLFACVSHGHQSFRKDELDGISRTHEGILFSCETVFFSHLFGSLICAPQ